jgi:hypothetical protein
MKKSKQITINQQVLSAIEKFHEKHYYLDNNRKLRSCFASVADAIDCETGEVLYHVLTSYNTVVAIIDVQTDTLIDVLRLVYGYTATSAQHISKFAKDYGRSMWGCANVLRYYPV